MGGTVAAAEFRFTLGASIGFAFGFGEDIVAHLGAIGAMLIGGSMAAALAAWMVSRLNPIMLGGFVGTAIAALNISNVYEGLGFAPSTPWVVIIHVAIVALGIGATIRGHRKARAQRAEALAAEEAAAADAPAVRTHEGATTG